MARELPSEHEANRARNAADVAREREEAQRQAARLRAAVDALLKTEEGRLVWGWFFERCGYNKPVLMRLAGGDVAPLSTEALAAQREVYVAARKLATPELLARAEYETEFGVPLQEKGK